MLYKLCFALLFLSLPLLVSSCGELTEKEAYDVILELQDRVRESPPPLAEEEADEIAQKALSMLSKLGSSQSMVEEGMELRFAASRQCFRLASLFLHRHNDAATAKRLMLASVDIFKDIGSKSALAQARVLEKQLKRINEFFSGSHLEHAGDNGQNTSVDAVQN